MIRTALGLIILVLVYLALALSYYLIAGPRSRTASSVYTYAAAAQYTAEAFKTQPLETAPGGWTPTAELVTAVTAAFPSSQQDQREELGVPDGAVAAALEFLAVTGSGDVAAYNAWRRAQGYTFPEDFTPRMKEAKFHDVLIARYEGVMHKNPPKDISAKQYFDAIFKAYPAQDHGALRPAGIAVSPLAAECRYKYITHPDDHMGSAQPSSEGLGSIFWTGGMTGSCVEFWQYDRTREELVEQHGGLWLARLWLAVRGQTGSTIPTEIWLFNDPGRGWRVKWWVVNNVGKSARSTNAYAACGVFSSSRGRGLLDRLRRLRLDIIRMARRLRSFFRSHRLLRLARQLVDLLRAQDAALFEDLSLLDGQSG